MAFMPAEEDDYDSDDGFIGNETWCQNEIGGFNSRLITGHTQNHVGNAADGTFISRTQSDSSFTQPGPETAMFYKHQYTNVLSMEDFRMAVMKGNTELVEKCLHQGQGVDTPLQCGWTVLMYAGNSGQPDMVRLLLQKGASPNSHCDMLTVLMCACSSSSHNEEHIRECVQILAEAGADVNAKDRYHTTPLMLASRDKHVLAVKELIRHRADVNRQDSRGWTALTWATQRAAKDVVLELLDSGADPNIQHLDKLTVKDLAAHLPTDEMLALLEHRPPTMVTGAGDMSLCTYRNRVTGSNSNLKESAARSTDLRYGELEVFLLGLDLSHLVDLFQQQLIDLTLLMTLTEQDLINAGVDQVGARKKLLDAVQALHKKDWQPSSLVSIHFNKQIRCSDATAILANSSKHLRYISSTILYVREQMKRHPEQMTQATDQADGKQLVRHTEDAIKNVLGLTAELESLQSELLKEIKKRNVDPPDFVDKSSRKHTKSSQIKHICCGLVLGLCMSAVLCYRRVNVQKFWRMSPW